MAISDLQIVKEAFLDEHRFLEARGPDWVPNLCRIVERIKRLEKRRDAAHKAAQRDMAEILYPHTGGSHG